MPNIHVPLPETQQSIFRPIVIEIVKQVQNLTKMKDTTIYFPEDSKMHHAAGTIDSTSDRYVVTTSKRMNNIQVEEEVDREEISPTFFDGREYRPILEDRLLGLKISPVYAKHNVSVTFNYSTGSKTEALRWLQDMRMKLARMCDINEHSVRYHYNLNRTAYEITKKVHELREQQAGYGDALDDYIRLCATPRLTVIGDLTDKHRIFAVSETQTEIYGTFDFDALPSKPEKDQESGMWVIAFTYKFNYDKPVGCHVRYPIVVHNQLMPYEWVSFTSEETRARAKAVVEGSRTQEALRDFRADVQIDRVRSQDGVLLIPRFDDFKTSGTLGRTASVVQALAIVPPNDRKELLSLTELGDVVLDDDILEFFRAVEYPFLVQPYKSLFNISLYQGDFLQDHRRLQISNQLVVRSTFDLDIRKVYHLRLSVVTDLDMVTRDAVSRIRLYPKAMYRLVSAVNRAFRENPEMSRLCYQSRLEPFEFNAIYRHLLKKENVGPFEQPGWTIQGFLKENGVPDQVVRKIIHDSRHVAGTMIAGVLAHRRQDPSDPAVGAGTLVTPGTLG